MRSQKGDPAFFDSIIKKTGHSGSGYHILNMCVEAKHTVGGQKKGAVGGEKMTLTVIGVL